MMLNDVGKMLQNCHATRTALISSHIKKKKKIVNAFRTDIITQGKKQYDFQSWKDKA